MGIVNTLIYLGMGLFFLTIGTVIFSYSTKMKEKELIAINGNVAVALMLSGKMLGLAIVIMSAAKYSVGLLDYALWSIIGIILQIVCYWVVEHLIFPKISLSQKVEEGNVAIGAMLFVISVSVGLIISSAISY
ncbi:MAG: DUF350 domain-containing protein [Bacillaceae bacterium]